MIDPKVTAAQAEAERTRAALIETVAELTQRLQPRNLAHAAWESAKNKGADIAEDAVDAVKSRPVAVGGVVAALAMFLARDPIKGAARRFYDGMTSSGDETGEPIASPKVRVARARPRTTARPSSRKGKSA